MLPAEVLPAPAQPLVQTAILPPAKTATAQPVIPAPRRAVRIPVLLIAFLLRLPAPTATQAVMIPATERPGINVMTRRAVFPAEAPLARDRLILQAVQTAILPLAKTAAEQPIISANPRQAAFPAEVRLVRDRLLLQAAHTALLLPAKTAAAQLTIPVNPAQTPAQADQPRSLVLQIRTRFLQVQRNAATPAISARIKPVQLQPVATQASKPAPDGAARLVRPQMQTVLLLQDGIALIRLQAAPILVDSGEEDVPCPPNGVIAPASTAVIPVKDAQMPDATAFGIAVHINLGLISENPGFIRDFLLKANNKTRDCFPGFV